MAFRIALIGITVLLLASCAQVGTLSGGDEDVIAPRPIQMNPPQNTLNFSEKRISIEFDEYIQLANTQQSIFMVPADAQLETKLSKKTLEISWKEELQANTTYVIYLNSAIRDLTEGNDSLMTYVFSTGNEIDSLEYMTTVSNAFTGDPIKECLVGLFKNSSDKKPIYFSRTNASGKATMNNIKAGNYFVRAYKDEDRDLQVNLSEARAFRSEVLELDSSKIDSVPLQFYTPKNEKIGKLRFYAPGILSLSAGYPLTNTEFQLNGKTVESNRMRIVQPDSVLFFTETDTLTQVKLIANSTNRTDTVSMILSKKDKSIAPKLITVKKTPNYSPIDTLSFDYSDLITGLNPSKIQAVNLSDTSMIDLNSVTYTNNLIKVELPRTKKQDVVLTFQKGAFSSLNSSANDSVSFQLRLLDEKEYGTINLTLWESDSPLFVEILLGNNVVSKQSVVSNNSVTFPFLEPGEYRFRVTADANQNGLWDTGNDQIALQPEKIFLFSTKTKVRANWEVDVQLEPLNE